MPRSGYRPSPTRLLLLLTLALAACSKQAPPAPSPRLVVAVAAQAEAGAFPEVLPAQIAARYTTPLSFRIGGKLAERSARLGDTVKLGQALARLDPASVDKNLASARAQLEAAQHQLDYAKRQFDRDQAQRQENLIAPAQLEQTANAYAAAQAQLTQAVQQASLAGDQLQYATLAADHAGVITAELADTGQNVTAGQAVYSLAWSGDIDALCDVPESLVARLAPGQAATITASGLPGRAFKARVREISPAADPQSLTYRVKLGIEAPGPELRLGMVADAAFVPTATTQAQVFTLPSTALFHDGEAPAVWVVKPGDDTLALRKVKLDRHGERTITVSDGLAAGDRVVWQGVHTMSAGDKVRVIAPLHPEDFAR